MSALKKTVLTAVAFAGALWTLNAGATADSTKHVGPDAKQWDQIVDKAVAF